MLVAVSGRAVQTLWGSDEVLQGAGGGGQVLGAGWAGFWDSSSTSTRAALHSKKASQLGRKETLIRDTY